MQGTMQDRPRTLAHFFDRAEKYTSVKEIVTGTATGVERTTYGAWAERTRGGQGQAAPHRRVGEPGGHGGTGRRGGGRRGSGRAAEDRAPVAGAGHRRRRDGEQSDDDDDGEDGD